MAKKLTYFIGTLILVILATSVYIMLPGNTKLQIDGSKTTFSVFENNKFVTSGIEYNSIYQGTKKMNPDTSMDKIYNFTEGTKVKLIREREYINGEKIIDTYEFDGSINDVKLFPISHKIEIINAKDKFFRYEIKKLIQNNPTGDFTQNPINFGKNMKLTYQEKNKKWASLYKNSLAIQYSIPSDYEVYEIRFFDPVTDISFVSPTPDNSSTQFSTSIPVNISVSSSLNHYTLLDFDRSLVLWMRMDDTNSTGHPIDISTYSNNGTLKNDTLINSTGKFGNASWYDGVKDYIDLPVSDSLNLSYNFTLAAWIYPRAFSSGSIIKRGEDIDNLDNSMYEFYHFKSDISFVIGNGTSRVTTFTNIDICPANQWCFVVCSLNETYSMQCYINGVNLGTPVTPTITRKSLDSVQYIGTRNTTSVATSNFFNGSIDEVMIFNRALSITEIQSLYNASAFQYYNNFTGLPEGTHNFTGYGVDTSGDKNQTDMRYITIDFTFIDLLINFSSGIYGVIFNPRRANDQDVWAVNQTNTKGVFNLTNNGTLINNVNIRFNQTQQGWQMECNNRTSGSWTNLTTSWQRIYSNLGVGNNFMVWCRVDLDYPENIWSGQVEFNATE